MKVLRNSGHERVVDILRPLLLSGASLDFASGELSLFAFHELIDELKAVKRIRSILSPDVDPLQVLGADADRPRRNKLIAPWLASELASWLSLSADVRAAPGGVPQGAAVVRDPAGSPSHALLGAFSFTTDGLGNYLDAFGAVPAFVPDDRGGFVRFFPLQGGDARRGFLAFEVARQCQGRRYRTRFELPFSEVTFAPIDFRLHVSAIARQGTPCEDEAALWGGSDPLIDAIAQIGSRFGNKLYPSVAAALAAATEVR